MSASVLKARVLVPVVLVTVLAAACVRPPYTGNLEGKKIAIVGDSITYIADPAIHQVLDSRYAVSIFGVPGVRTAQQEYASMEYAATDPDIVVVNLGTNDLLQGASPSATIADLDELRRIFGDACLVFATITTMTFDPNLIERAPTVNQWIRSQAHVADWDQAVSAEGTEGQYTTDTIHPSDKGSRLLAQLIDDQVRACDT